MFNVRKQRYIMKLFMFALYTFKKIFNTPVTSNVLQLPGQ